MTLKFLKHPVINILIGSFIVILLVALFKEGISKPILSILTDSEDWLKFFTALISSPIMIAAYYLFTRFYQKKEFNDFNLKDATKDSLKGLLLGFGSMSATVGLLALLGYYQFHHFNNLTAFLPTLAFIFGAAILEEIIFRGLIFKELEAWKGPITALLVSAIIFQIPHFMNSHTGVLPALLGVLFGLTVGLMYAYKRTLWMPILFHFGWNIVQPVFGTTLSGVEEFTALTTARLEGPQLFIGSKFGLEVSIFSFLSLILISIYYFVQLNRNAYFKI